MVSSVGWRSSRSVAKAGPERSTRSFPGSLPGKAEDSHSLGTTAFGGGALAVSQRPRTNRSPPTPRPRKGRVRTGATPGLGVANTRRRRAFRRQIFGGLVQIGIPAKRASSRKNPGKVLEVQSGSRMVVGAAAAASEKAMAMRWSS